MPGERSFEDLLDEALTAPIRGWDFSFPLDR
jgi:hypothetical protein